MKKVVAFLLVLLWMAVVLLFSLQSGVVSNDLSYVISRHIIAILDTVWGGSCDIETINLLVRKCFHIIEYMLMAVFLALALFRFSRKAWLGVLMAWVSAVGFAFFDEWVQRSSPGRTSSLFDVMMDTFGITLGLILFTAIYRMMCTESSPKENIE